MKIKATSSLRLGTCSSALTSLERTDAAVSDKGELHYRAKGQTAATPANSMLSTAIKVDIFLFMVTLRPSNFRHSTRSIAAISAPSRL